VQIITPMGVCYQPEWDADNKGVSAQIEGGFDAVLERSPHLKRLKRLEICIVHVPGPEGALSISEVRCNGCDSSPYVKFPRMSQHQVFSFQLIKS
jgi:hypothetical protein